jgi:hypothetical protein
MISMRADAFSSPSPALFITLFSLLFMADSMYFLHLLPIQSFQTRTCYSLCRPWLFFKAHPITDIINDYGFLSMKQTRIPAYTFADFFIPSVHAVILKTVYSVYPINTIYWHVSYILIYMIFIQLSLKRNNWDFSLQKQLFIEQRNQ